MRLVPVLLLSGCATFAFSGQRSAIGFVYTDAYTPQTLTPNAIGKKKGEACATSVLGLVTNGEAGIRDAADAGGITYISSVDTTFRNILGVWSKYCTIVSGDDQPLAPPPAPVEAAPAEPTPAEPAPADPAPAPAPAPPAPTPG
jgi:hypothetical protein